MLSQPNKRSEMGGRIGRESSTTGVEQVEFDGVSWTVVDEQGGGSPRGRKTRSASECAEPTGVN